MNCKEGDKAIIVRSAYGNLDKLVLVVRPSPGNGLPVGAAYKLNGVTWHNSNTNFKWVVKSLSASGLTDCAGGNHRSMAVSDSKLRPIRDPGDDAVDEMVRIIGKPKVLEKV